MTPESHTLEIPELLCIWPGTNTFSNLNFEVSLRERGNTHLQAYLIENIPSGTAMISLGDRHLVQIAPERMQCAPYNIVVQR